MPHVDGSTVSRFHIVDDFCKKMFTGIGVGREGVFLSFILDRGCYGGSQKWTGCGFGKSVLGGGNQGGPRQQFGLNLWLGCEVLGWGGV